MKPDELAPRIPPVGPTHTLPENRSVAEDQVRVPSAEMFRGSVGFGEPIDPEGGNALLSGPSTDELIQAALDEEAQNRLWLRAIIPLLQLRSHDPDPSGRVQLAFDLMHIAACERASRLLRSDLVHDGDPRMA